jgi:outer membrane protein
LYNLPSFFKATKFASGGIVSGGNGSYTYLWESSTTSSSTGFSAASGINTNANYSVNTGASINPVTNQFQNQTFKSFSASASSNFTLFNGLANWKVAQRAKLSRIAGAKAYKRGDTSKIYPLAFVRFEPYVAPKQNLAVTGQRVDTRVLQVIYALPEGTDLFTGQQMDVYVEEQAGNKS